jgi:protoheme IX farnesyltransferase
VVPDDQEAAARFAVGLDHRWSVVFETTELAQPVVVRVASRVRAYVLLTKPRVIELLLVTTVPAMVLAAGRLPSLSLMAAVLLGGALAAGGANTINCWIERDRDRVMRRTRHRPLPAGRIEPSRALVFGVALEAVASVWLWSTVNLLAAVLAVGAMLFYVFVYTIWLKPRSPQNIVIGGAAGAVPVLVGWAAVTGRLDAPAWLLFAIVFCWTPPHFWALSLRYREDYAAAGIPMLPVVSGIATAVRQIIVYSVLVVAITLLLFQFETLGVVYFAAAVGLGAAFVWHAFALRRDASPQRAMRLFSFSNTYLGLLFAAIAVDTLLRAY